MGWTIKNGASVYEPDVPVETMGGGIISGAQPTGVVPKDKALPLMPTQNTTNQLTGVNPMDNPRKFAEDLYMDNLGRAGESAGVDYWAGEFAKGGSFEDVNKAFKTAASQNYEDYLTNPNSKWKDYGQIDQSLKLDANNQIAAGTGKAQWDDQYLQKNALKPDVYNKLYSRDLIGTRPYNDKMGKNVLNSSGGRNTGYEVGNQYRAWDAQGATDGSSADFGNMYNEKNYFPLQGTFNKGVNPSEVYKAAGLNTAESHFLGGENNSKWDTLNERNKRIDALVSAGLTQEEARKEAMNGFSLQGDAMGDYEGRADGMGRSAAEQAAMDAQGINGGYDPSLIGTPSAWNVTPDQTMEGRINSLTDPNNPLIAQARARALMEMNGRGLVNSSMAQTAADAAAYQVAMPIAQNDSATFAKAAGYNTDQLNQVAAQNAGIINQAGQFNISTANDMDKFNRNLLTSKELAQADSIDRVKLAEMDAVNRVNLAKLDATTRTELMGVEANYKNLMQTNQSASNLYQEATARIAAIQMSDLSSDAKNNAIYNLKVNLNDGLRVLGGISGLNLGDLLMEPTAPEESPVDNRYYNPKFQPRDYQ